MSPQETQALQDFLNQLTQVRGIAKDAQAEAMIAAAVAQQPDAAYLLVQRALLMEQALKTSQAQVAQLQSQVQSLQAGAGRSSGFLDGNAWGNAPAAAARPAVAPAAAAPAYNPAYNPAYAPAAPVAAAPAPAPSSGFFGGGMGSVLGSVAATAAGVAGGAFLFQGIEHLFNGGSGSGWAHQNGLSAPVETIENTTVNNYYGSDGDNKSDLAGNDRFSDNSNASDNSDNFGSNSDLADLSNFDLDDSGGYDDSLV
jgi:hypothetical protein